MPAKAKFLKGFMLTLLCFGLLFAVGLSFGMHSSTKDVAKAEPAQLIDLNDNAVLAQAYATAGSSFQTASGGSYDPVTNPYIISSADDLIRLAYLVDILKDTTFASASYALTNHINLSAYNWRPIGSLDLGNGEIPFSGTFNGNGYSIFGLTTNLYYYYDNSSLLQTSTQPVETSSTVNGTSVGLFGAVRYQTAKTYIKLLGLSNTKIHTNACYTGSVAGIILGDPTDTDINMVSTTVSDAVASAVIQECYNKGLVDGGTYVGGIAGYVADGAVVFNCSNSEMPLEEYAEVHYGEGDDQGKIAVYSMFEDSNVGGIVGGIEETTNKAVVLSCINTASVAKLGNDDNVGGILGYFPSGSKEKYKINIFYRDVIHTSNTTNVAGVGQTLNNMVTRYSTYNQFSIKQAGAGEYLPYTRGETPDRIWHWGPSVNNGIPYLTRVSPLMKVEIEVNETDGVVPATINFVGYDTNGNSVSPMTWYNPVVVSGGVFYVELGKSVPLNTQILSQYENNFEFVNWEMEELLTNVTDLDSASAIMTANILFVASDGKYSAVYDYIYYDINVVSENTLFGAVAYQNPISNDSLNVDWENVAYQSNGLIHARKGDVVRVKSLPSAGYEFLSAESANSIAFDVIESGLIEFVVSQNDILTFKFSKKSYAIGVVVPQNSSNVDLCDISFSFDGGAYTTSTTSASFNSFVEIKVENIITNYFLDHFVVSANGLQEYSLDKGVNTFVLQDYDDYVITPVFRKQTYFVTLNQNSNNFELSFITPDTNSVQQSIEFDQSFEVAVLNIANGYTFVEWNVEYAGDSTESWTTSNTNLQKQGLSGNVVLSAVITIEQHSVSLSVVGNGTVTNSGSQTVDYGTTISSVATAQNGNRFVGWFDNLNNLLTKKATLTQTITEDFSAYAKFEVINYNVVFSVVADDGTIFATNTVNQSKPTGKYLYGESVQFSVVCPAGYQFNNFVMQSNIEQSNYVFNEDGTGEIYSVNKDAFVIVNLKLIQFDVTFAINDIRFGDLSFNYDGWSKLSNNIMSTIYHYPYKSELKAIVLSQSEAPFADVAKNYAFAYWLVNNVPYDVGTTLTIPVVENLSIKAIYRPLNYKFTLTKTYNEGATVLGLSSDYFEFGTTVSLDVSVNSGFQFNGWFNYNIVTRESTLISSNKQVNILVDEPKNIVCSLSKLGTVVVSQNDQNAGTVSGAGNYKVGTRVTLVANPNDDSVFDCWKMNDKTVSNNSSLTIDVEEGTQIYQAVFSPKFAVSITPNNKKLGSVEVNNVDGQNVELVAVANNNCSFVGWAYNNEIISTSNVYNLNLNGDVNLEAVFKRDFNWNILIIVAGCVLFAVALLIIAIQYVRSREAEPIKTNYILKTPDNKSIEPRKKLNKEDIEAIPVRKVNPNEIEPVPVRKTYTKPKTYVHKPLKNEDKSKK